MQGKSRLFIGFTAVLLLSIFVLFHSSQRQMDELRVAGLKCEQHEMALRAQYDGHVEKLAQLERSLEISRTSGDGKLRAEKDLREKALKDANLRFSSLQHHYKSLKSEHEDAKSEWGTAKQIQQEKINSLTKVLAASEKQWKVRSINLLAYVFINPCLLYTIAVKELQIGDEVQQAGGCYGKPIGWSREP